MNSLQQVSKMVPFYLWWALPFSLILVISSRGYKYRNFFKQIGFCDYKGKLPHYIGSAKASPYLLKVSFRSKIPLDEWNKISPLMEQLKRRRIYRTEQPRDDVSRTDIFYIQEELPRFIPWEDRYLPEGESEFAVGEGYLGKVIWDVSLLPHGVCAGATSAGKTNLLRIIARQAIAKKWNVQVLDLKNGGDYASVEREAQNYRDLESGYGPFIIGEPEEARQLLLALTIEVKSRLATFKEVGVSNIAEYNARGQGHFVSWMLIVDEAAELLDVKPKDKSEKEMYAEIDHYLRTLARTSRAAGVHILMGFIRPDANVLDGQVKNNLLWRVCGFFADPAASRIVLDNSKATELPPEVKGRFIIGEEEAQAYYLPTAPPDARPPCEA